MTTLHDLNPAQKSAVTAGEGPLLILAGAGSGKTRVLTRRVSYLIGEMGVPPWAILALTFTNKAAEEMRRRIYDQVGAQKDLWIGTFHSVCNRILRIEGSVLGYPDGFTIYDTYDQKKVIKAAMDEVGIDEKELNVNYFRSIISAAKEKGETPTEYLEAHSFLPKERFAGQVYAAYEKRLKEAQAMDFDDLLLKTRDLFMNHPDVLQKYRNRFRHILVDEYQDTNRVQYDLVNLLAEEHRNLFVVGDDDQSIYGWRGADIRNILDFEKDYPDCVTIRLEQNYRSVGSILKAANAVIMNNQGRKGKALWTDKDDGDKPLVVARETEQDEAKFIATESGRLTSHGQYKLRDVAVLYRTNMQSRIIEEMFVRYGIPYRVLGGQRFYERKEIKDVLSYLRFIANPRDDVSLERIINTPKRGIGDSTIEKIRLLAEEQGRSMYDVMGDLSALGLNRRTENALNAFMDMMDALILKAPGLSVEKLLFAVLEETGYSAALKAENTQEADSRLENIGELIGSAIDFEVNTEEEDRTLNNFLSGVALVSDTDDMKDDEDKVTLMTLHSAKGLEFPVVFLCGMEDGLFPIMRAAVSKKELEEERRLCYVGITRAEEKLYLTYANTRNVFGKKNYNMPSRFIAELAGTIQKEKSSFQPAPKQDGSIAIERTVSYRQPMSKKPESFGAPKAEKPVSFEAFAAGDRVEHAKFGEGTVVHFDENKSLIEVEFASVGVKKLDLRFAPVKKLRA